jgi:hypothetical protein
MTNLTVDFILPQTDEDAPPPGARDSKTCSCGSRQFALVSEMKAEAIKGVPASRMYECLGCGEYRLG